MHRHVHKSSRNNLLEILALFFEPRCVQSGEDGRVWIAGCPSRRGRFLWTVDVDGIYEERLYSEQIHISPRGPVRVGPARLAHVWKRSAFTGGPGLFP